MNEHSEASIIQLKNSRNVAIRDEGARDGVVGHLCCWGPLKGGVYEIINLCPIFLPRAAIAHTLAFPCVVQPRQNCK